MEYNNITEIAYKALLSQNFTTFPLDLTAFSVNNCYIISFQKYAQLTNISVQELTADFAFSDGYFIPNIHGKMLILYNSISSPARLNFTIAHELGHALLKHKGSNIIYESEANFFASELLMPTAIINYLIEAETKINKEFLIDFFGVSSSAAEIKLKYIKKSLILHTRLDSAICSKFSKQIRKYSKKLAETDLKNSEQLDKYEHYFF